MTVSDLLDRIKPAHVVICCLAVISCNVLVNISITENQTLVVFNSVFEVSMSLLLTILSAILFTISRKRQYVFARTLMWMGMAFFAWTVGDALYLYHVLINVDPFISSADICYVSATLLVLMAALSVRGIKPSSVRRRMVTIEISILVLSATIIFTVVLLMPGKANLNFDPFTMLMIFIYPVLDIILLWSILIMFFTFPVRKSQKVLGIIFFGALFIFFSDLFYLINNLYATLVDDYFVDMGYYFFYTWLFLAGFVGFKEIRNKTHDDEQAVNPFNQGNWIVFLPGGLLIVVISLLLVFVLNQSAMLFHGIIILIAVVIILFIVHQYLVIVENFKLTRELKLINSQLEKKVELRTTELSIANSELQEEMQEREKVEQYLATINKQLSLANSEKDKLFSIMAHDLRSPMGSIMKLSELLVENIHDFEEEELSEVSGTLYKSATQTFQLLNDLLAWSALQMGRGSMKKELFPIRQTVSEVLSLLKPEAERKQISLVAEMEENLVVFADKFAIETVLRNLVNNAIKFTPPSGKIIVNALLNDVNVTVSVIDNGIGIPKEKQEKMFKVDSLNSTPGTEGEKGTGFGLLLCKDLIGKNGGTLWLVSEKDQGSTFSFTLPVENIPESLASKAKADPAARIQYKCDYPKKLAFAVFTGDFSTDSLRSEISKIWGNRDFNPDYPVLIDMRQASFTMDMKELPDILGIFASMPGTKEDRKFAMLTATPHQVAYSTLFGQNISSVLPLKVEIFSTYESAIKWLSE